LLVLCVQVIHFMHDKYNYERLQMALHDTHVRRCDDVALQNMAVILATSAVTRRCWGRQWHSPSKISYAGALHTAEHTAEHHQHKQGVSVAAWSSHV
jgi:pyruvate-formate lyase